MQPPRAPDPDRAECLLDVLAELIARGGASSFLAPPVVPGPAAFPEPWRPTRGGTVALLRRLAWHAHGFLGPSAREIRVSDERLGAPPTERKPATRVALLRVTAKELVFRVELLGEDDVAGTLAHELGVAHAAVNRPASADPYRSADAPVIEVDVDRDLERGSIATVYLGLGVLAANAAFQEYSRPGRFNGGYSPLEYDVLRAGFVPMSELAYLLAVQAVVRDEATPPPGLSAPQRDEVTAWIAILRGQGAELRRRLGIAADAVARAERPAVTPFDDVDVDDEPAPAPRTAFRWRTHRGGVGFFAGAVLGVGVAAAVASPAAAPWIIVGAASSGHVVGRRVRVPRCSACASVVDDGATTCERCRAALRGDIDSLAERLEAEERLLERDRELP